MKDLKTLPHVVTITFTICTSNKDSFLQIHTNYIKVHSPGKLSEKD